MEKSSDLRERMPLLDEEKQKEFGLSSNHEDRERAPAPYYARSSFFTLLAVAIGFTLLFLAGIIAGFASEAASENICITPECVLASAEILSSRSPNYQNIEPCDDFRTYMCEGFDATHDLRPDQSDVSSLSVLAERGQALLRHILEAPFSKTMASGKHSHVDKDNFEKLHDAYGACLNETAIKSKGADPLIKLVQHVTEIFKSEKSWTETYSFLMSVGIEPLISLDIQVRIIFQTRVKSSLTTVRLMRKIQT